MSDIKLWRYYLPEGSSEEWAEIVMTSAGMFAATSDWGNYSFSWRSFGKCFRSWLVSMSNDPDYFIGCLGGPLVYDAEATYVAVVNRITELRDTKGRAFVGEGFRTLDGCSRLESPIWFGTWLAKTEVEEPHLLYREARHPWVKSFCERILPRLAAAIRTELAAEAADV
jgi:hypothetical protein